MAKTLEMSDTAYWDMLVRRSVSRFLLLSCLAKRPMHGYELGKEMRESYAGCCEPSEAMIYPTLRQLQEGGYIVCREEISRGREVKVCELTQLGHHAFEEAARVWGRVIPHLNQAIDDAQTPILAELMGQECCPTDEEGGI